MLESKNRWLSSRLQSQFAQVFSLVPIQELPNSYAIARPARMLFRSHECLYRISAPCLRLASSQTTRRVGFVFSSHVFDLAAHAQDASKVFTKRSPRLGSFFQLSSLGRNQKLETVVKTVLQ